MKVRITTAIAAVAVLVGVSAPAAGAATESTLTGKMTSISYDKAKQTGKLHIISSKGTKTTIALNSKTDCGVARGQSGDQVPCKTLVSPKYRNKVVRVTAKRYSDGHRVASVIGVQLV